MKDPISIPLPSLIHRIGRNNVNRVKAIASEHQCMLKRIRRSRNWQLVGEATQVLLTKQALKKLNDLDLSYLIKKLEAELLKHADKLEPLEAKLERLITEQPSITLAELMEQCQCTLAQARAARFNIDI